MSFKDYVKCSTKSWLGIGMRYATAYLSMLKNGMHVGQHFSYRFQKEMLRVVGPVFHGCCIYNVTKEQRPSNTGN